MPTERSESLTARLNAIRENLTLLDKQMKGGLDIGRMNTLEGDFRTSYQDLIIAQGYAETFVRFGGLQGENLPSSVDLASKLGEVKSRVQGPAAALMDGQEFADFKKSFKTFHTNIHNATNVQWESLVADATRGWDETFNNAVKRMPGMKVQADKIASAYRQVESKSLQRPKSEGEWKAFKADQKVFQQARKDFKEIPGAVIEFWDKASARRGASLDSMTEEVKEWLRANDLLKLVRFRVG